MVVFHEDEKSLIKLFGTEPKVFDEDAFIYEYKHKDIHGYELEFHSVLIERYVILTLNHINISASLYDLTFHEVKDIKTFDNGFTINFFDIKIQNQVYFSPNFSLKMQLGRLRKVYTYTMYDNTKLCELFKINRDEAKINNGLHSFQHKNGNYIFTLTFTPQKRHAVIVLKDINLQLPLYEITINNISTIEAINEKPERLLIHLWGSDQILQVTFNPYFLLNISEQEWLDKINAYRNL